MKYRSTRISAILDGIFYSLMAAGIGFMALQIFLASGFSPIFLPLVGIGIILLITAMASLTKNTTRQKATQKPGYRIPNLIIRKLSIRSLIIATALVMMLAVYFTLFQQALYSLLD